jgi:hypothetical protein
MEAADMSTESDLDQLDHIRNSAERETYRDGLMELVVGVLFFIVALATGRPAFYWTYLVAILILGPGLKRLKARYTYPRIGFVRLPDEQPQRVRRGIVTWVLGVFLLVAVVLTLTGHLTDNLAWRRAAPGLGGILFAGGFLYLAQRSRLRRHYLLAVASAGLGVLMTWPLVKEPYGNLRVWALLMALLSLSMGAQVLRRFMREHPIVEERTPDVG